MRFSTITLLAFALAFAGCSDSDEPLQGWKESEVEIVNEGTAPGSSSQIVVPGDATTAPMTGTNFDTSTDLDMITDEQLGLVSDEPGPARTMTEQRPEPEPTRSAPAPAPATSTTRQSTPSPPPAEPDPEPAPPASDDDERESETPEAEEEETIQPEESLPPIIIPAPDPPSRPQPEQSVPPAATDTAAL